MNTFHHIHHRMNIIKLRDLTRQTNIAQRRQLSDVTSNSTARTQPTPNVRWGVRAAWTEYKWESGITYWTPERRWYARCSAGRNKVASLFIRPQRIAQLQQLYTTSTPRMKLLYMGSRWRHSVYSTKRRRVGGIEYQQYTDRRLCIVCIHSSFIGFIHFQRKIIISNVRAGQKRQ